MSGTQALGVPSQTSVRNPGSRGVSYTPWLAALLVLSVACAQQDRASVESATSVAQALDDSERQRSTPVGLALEVNDGVPVPLKVRAGQSFFINQIDLSATAQSSVDEGVNGLRRAGDFSRLAWQGVRQVDQEPVLTPNADGTYTQRRFFRQAQWMEQPSVILVQPVDSRGRPTGRTIPLQIGSDDRVRGNDDFFIRRLRAVQYVNDCPALPACAGAHSFSEEGVVELRKARTGATSFTLSPDTAALRVSWTARDGAPYLIPVQQVESPRYAYGFSIDIKAVTPPSADGTYAPGSRVTFQMTLRDGAGNRLHPVGSLPTYNEVVFGQNEAGIQYYRGFFEHTATYYLRKHRERMLATSIIGPVQSLQPIRNIVEMDAFLAPTDAITMASREKDGFFAQAAMVPAAYNLFGGAFDPSHAAWAAPVSDTWTYQLPANAEPGTYLVTVKGSRVYMGEDVPTSRTVEIQVGAPQRTVAKLATGGCDKCHTDGGELSKVLHGLDNRATCATCHAPLGFELEGPIAVRAHFIHSRGRVDVPLQKCSTCHVSEASTQRTSKAACLSCHTSYPASHVDRFGPITSMYVGGGRESFQQCTGSCHQTHPGSGF